MNYEAEFGPDKTEETILRLEPYLKELGSLGSVFQLRSNYIMNRAFRAYRNNRFSVVPRKVLTAITYKPKYITNRGVLSIFFRSMLKMIANLFGSSL